MTSMHITQWKRPCAVHEQVVYGPRKFLLNIFVMQIIIVKNLSSHVLAKTFWKCKYPDKQSDQQRIK